MKLELKHLAPYLPYEVEWIAPNKRICKLTGLNISFAQNPLLLPLSEITDPEKYGFRSTDLLIANVNQYSIGILMWNKLLTGHYDVFSLIPAGLALNKLTTKH